MAVKWEFLPGEFIRNWSTKNDFTPVFIKKAAKSGIPCKKKKEIHSGLPVYLSGTDFSGSMRDD
ncbi:hypothetical protein UA45_10070 [Morganella morganii]|uniref:Uncharacterized protein n=1 Tax=Morganella morganii TaxID=582 RepID=A0A0D8L9R0_MORMO|nr:hypothetical protein UA45_10070 [Morganella morganii]